ncbi:MAG: lysophospholipase [Betaproteobacteria bacterium]|nr:MAG: lysophospholipase [Betaproteobacteria bacterium]
MKAFAAIVIALAALAEVGYLGRVYATHAMARRAMTPKALGANTPANAGLPFSRVAVEAGDRTLIGWWVRARADSGKVPPAVMFLHGNRSSISDYVNLQRFLYRQGISSFVFDYSGFGASGGSASLTTAVGDAASAARVFEDSAGKGARRIAMGSALGATVLMQAIDSVQPHVDGVVIEGVTASVKESAIRDGRIPKLLAPLLTDVGDNVVAARRVKVPLLAVHSYADTRFPIEDAQRVVAAVPAHSSLVRHWRKGHSALLASSKVCDWEPVLQFVKAGALPPARLDTTDQCVVAERLAAAQKAGLPKPSVTPAGAVALSKPVAGEPATATKSAPSTTKTTSTKAGATTKTTTTQAGATKTSTKTTPKKSTKKPSTTTKTRTAAPTKTP